jgi:hypothetical protein
MSWEVGRGGRRKTLIILRGTEGSNPSPSSAESSANLTFGCESYPSGEDKAFAHGLYGGWAMILSGIKTLLETGEMLPPIGGLTVGLRIAPHGRA